NGPKRAPGTFLPGLTVNSVADGTSNTLLALEAAEPSEWTRPDDFPLHLDVGDKPKEPAFPKLGASLRGEFHALNITGDIYILPTTVAPADLLAFITPTGREQLSDAFYKSIAARPKPWQRVPIRVPVGLSDAQARRRAVENYRAILKGIRAWANNN